MGTNPYPWKLNKNQWNYSKQQSQAEHHRYRFHHHQNLISKTKDLRVCVFFFFLFLSSIIARESPIISHATVGSLAPALHLLFSCQTPSLSSLKNLFSSSPLSLSISLIPFVFQIFFIFFAPPFVLFLSFFLFLHYPREPSIMVTKVKPLTILSLLLPFMVSLFLLAKGAHCFEGKKKLHLHKLQWQQKSGSSSSCVSHQKSSEFSSFWVSGGKRKWSWLNLFKCWPWFDLISFNFNYSPLWKLLFCFIYGNTYYYPLSLFHSSLEMNLKLKVRINW